MLAARSFKQERFETASGRRLITRADFIGRFRRAIESGRPLAAARIGISEQHWMYYPILLAQNPLTTTRRVYEQVLRYHGHLQSGIFPADPGFFREFNQFYVEQVRALDVLGLILDPVMDPALVEYYHLTNPLLYYKDLNPDRSSPSRPDNCYLRYFEGKKILLVCPFAGFLKPRATRETFEQVWAKTGRKWFYPAQVGAVEFPYGFERETQARYRTALDLLAAITRRVEQEDFDIAMIAAAGLTIPIAAFVRSMGKQAISFGAELQILFGVSGKRWRGLERWQRDYFNDSWVDLPEHYRPRYAEADEGAYW